ncbi:hypothetical protein Deipe_1696 [Deinococcus peraridilitoris DSM 19664]|uniref:Uncharacterized protein n=1 Tax=Deinococcus peraridilitoris (strain DSM 19664 / LMG 22246 / CIP 109416 / KR-200) TaxID=937777 RepID=L0A229_DEIPD|nr:hypothetical protein Deipe_1696 [Deinococcus peraridilitoris DSM 19664]
MTAMTLQHVHDGRHRQPIPVNFKPVTPIHRPGHVMQGHWTSIRTGLASLRRIILAYCRPDLLGAQTHPL